MWWFSAKLRKLANEQTELYQEITKTKSDIVSLQQQILSIRNTLNRKLGYAGQKSDTNEEENNVNEREDLNDIIKAFGGSMPIELIEKYKRKQ